MNKKMVFNTLRMMFTSYEGYRSIGLSPKEARKRILELYSDFYEWLNEKVKP